MLTDKELNEHFVHIIPMLEKIVKGIAYKYNRKIETHAAINEAYLYLHENREILTDTDFMQRVAIKFLKSSIVWTNSKLNNQESVNGFDIDYLVEEPQEIDHPLETKLLIEEWYTEKRSILETYRAQEPDRIKQIIFDLFFKQEITKGVDLAKHLKINKDYACKYLREMKADIRNFAKSKL